MPVRGRALTVHYYAWDANASGPKTGDAANHAVVVRLDGGTPAAPAAAPTEVGAIAAPGWYAVSLAAGETDGDVLLLAGTSVTSGVIIQGTQIALERAPSPDDPAYAVLTAAGLDAVLPVSGLPASTRVTDATGTQLTALNARQILALLFAGSCGDRDGIGTSTITVSQPAGDMVLTATRVSRTRIESTVVAPE